MPRRTAHYYASRKRKILVIAEDFLARPTGKRIEIEVSGKVEARRIAAEHNAMRWNF